MNVDKLREDFPFFHRAGPAEIYFDNAATTQKPQAVIDRISAYYAGENANIHRGGYPLSQRLEKNCDAARETVRRFIGAASSDEIVFTRGTTDALNLAAQSIGTAYLKPGDHVIVTELEHHSNYLPWKVICEKQGAKLLTARAAPDGSLDPEEVTRLMDSRTRVVAVTHTSNVTGIQTDLRTIVKEAHRYGSLVVVDGTQAVAHTPVSVQELGADFFCFSGHKLYGPMGIGVLYGKKCYLEEMEPYQYGGGMIASIGADHSVSYKTSPEKWEAGTLPIAGILGLEVAVGYISEIGLDQIGEYEKNMTAYARRAIENIPGFHVVGNRECRAILSIWHDRISPYDLSVFLGLKGFAVRSGKHCAIPYVTRLGLPGTCRISLAFYNTQKEVDLLLEALTCAGTMGRGG